VIGALVALWLPLRPPEETADLAVDVPAPAPLRAPLAPARPDPRLLDPPLAEAPDDTDAPIGACPDALREVERRAEALAVECAHELGNDGLCFGPIPFQDTAEAASQIDAARERLAACGLDPAQLRFDCAENPCVALVDRAAVLEGEARCPALGDMRGALDEWDARWPPEGAWERWVGVAFLPPRDPLDAVRAHLRLEARRDAVERVLASADAGEHGTCANARRALEGFDGPHACAALREWWACPRSAAELPPGTLEEHVLRAERQVEQLAEDCPAFADAPRVLDCSTPPCLLLVDLPPDQDPLAPFCDHPRFRSTVVQDDHLATWLLDPEDERLRERLLEHGMLRMELARRELDALRQR